MTLEIRRLLVSDFFYKSDGFGFKMTLEIRWLWISDGFGYQMALDFK